MPDPTSAREARPRVSKKERLPKPRGLLRKLQWILAVLGVMVAMLHQVRGGFVELRSLYRTLFEPVKVEIPNSTFYRPRNPTFAFLGRPKAAKRT